MPSLGFDCLFARCVRRLVRHAHGQPLPLPGRSTLHLPLLVLNPCPHSIPGLLNTPLLTEVGKRTQTETYNIGLQEDPRPICESVRGAAAVNDCKSADPDVTVGERVVHPLQRRRSTTLRK
ncbi:unnamed protein product [Prunus armeniaca]|uniref:Uncharacterized protein n=1 Tax=Prunus armeniaca TaxID=36596 RepID=A0A6J5XYC0_PRUAR|nr:unnamed protein product [Prunus armeniaca]